MEGRPLDFHTWGRDVMGLAGQSVTQKQLDELMKEYTRYRAGFTPAPVQEAALSDGTRVAVLGNTMQVLREGQPRQVRFTDDEGFVNLLDMTTGLASRATNSTGAPVKETVKRSAWEDLVAAGQLQTPEKPPGFFSRIFGGLGSPPAAPPPTQQEQAAAPVVPMTEAADPPAGGVAPMHDSVEAVLAAARRGELTREAAQEILVKEFGLDP